MDLTDMLEQEKKRSANAAEELIKTKLNRQIRIFNKEKASFTSHSMFENSKHRRALAVLEVEKARELENYLATQSDAIEKKYKKEAGVVHGLLTTTDTVRELLGQDQGKQKEQEREILDLVTQTWDEKKRATEFWNKNTFRPLDREKMDRRVEWASGKFHTQLQKNRELQEKILSSMATRDKFMKEEARLSRELEKLNATVTATMAETSDIYEQRDRAEGTNRHLKEHLFKVKDQYERELLSLHLALNDDKKMDAFMRTKHKEITQALRQQREKDIAQVNYMVNKKDDFTAAFDVIRAATNKTDIDEIVDDFIIKEEDNFTTFLRIGELLDENEKIRSEIAEIRLSNVKMEEEQMDRISHHRLETKDAQSHIDSYKQKSEKCLERTTANSRVIDDFILKMHKLIGVLKIPATTLKDYVGKDGKIQDQNLIACLTAIEKEISSLLKDYYMVELSTRALSTKKLEQNAEEAKMVRTPSTRIEPNVAPRVVPAPIVKEKDDVEEIRTAALLRHEDIKDIVVKTMLANP